VGKPFGNVVKSSHLPITVILGSSPLSHSGKAQERKALADLASARAEPEQRHMRTIAAACAVRTVLLSRCMACACGSAVTLASPSAPD
jgi:hypothetical protein